MNANNPPSCNASQCLLHKRPPERWSLLAKSDFALIGWRTGLPLDRDAYAHTGVDNISADAIRKQTKSSWNTNVGRWVFDSTLLNVFFRGSWWLGFPTNSRTWLVLFRWISTNTETIRSHFHLGINIFHNLSLDAETKRSSCSTLEPVEKVLCLRNARSVPQKVDPGWGTQPVGNFKQQQKQKQRGLW